MNQSESIIVDPGHTPEGKPPKKGWKPGPGRGSRLKSVKDQRPDFVGKFELAHHLCCHVGTIGEWIGKGDIPPPHSRPGKSHPVWRRDHYEEFVKTGKWPRAAWGHQV
jgi:hypothetical protein